jgi:hypothetical protein
MQNYTIGQAAVGTAEIDGMPMLLLMKYLIMKRV